MARSCFSSPCRYFRWHIYSYIGVELACFAIMFDIPELSGRSCGAIGYLLLSYPSCLDNRQKNDVHVALSAYVFLPVAQIPLRHLLSLHIPFPFCPVPFHSFAVF